MKQIRNWRKSWLIMVCVAALAVFTLNCSSDEDPDTTNSDTSTVEGTLHQVSIENFAFVPATVTIAVGDTVRWTNNDSIDHTVTAGASGAETGEFDSGNIAAGGTFERTFTSAAALDYFCQIHPSMTATVTAE